MVRPAVRPQGEDGSGLSYAEFAGMIPRAGSAYTYGYVALGEVIAWFIGWDLLLEYIAIVAVVAIGISGHLDAFLAGFGADLPLAFTASAEEGGVINLPALLICLLVTFILSPWCRRSGSSPRCSSSRSCTGRPGCGSRSGS